MSENDNIRHPKPPTKRDLKILQWMDEGNFLDTAKAFQHFKTTGTRDIVYRLRQAGHIIFHKDVTYTTKDGERKSYRQWFTKEPEIMPNGKTTEVAYKPKVKNATDFANDLISQANKPSSTQATLFY